MILLIFQANEAILEMNIIWNHFSQTYQAESATRGSFSFSLMIMHSQSLGECKYFLEQEILNIFIVLIPWML